MPEADPQVSSDYLDTLLQYYEEEIEGEAYFYGLAEHFKEREKTLLLARVERKAASMLEYLLVHYRLQPRDDATLARSGREYVGTHREWEWGRFMSYIVERYPGYVDDFLGLEAMAPAADLPALKALTEHEEVVIDFARRELAGDVDSCQPLLDYLAKGRP